MKKVLPYALALSVSLAVGVWLFISFSSDARIRESIRAEVERYSELNPTQKAELAVILSANDYTRSHGTPPQSLSDLVPMYFDSIPLDPATQQPIAYALTGVQFKVGAQVATPQATTKTTAQQAHANPKAAVFPTAASAVAPVAPAATPNETSLNALTFDLASKRDPFEPPNLKPKKVVDNSRPELERYELAELRLTAIFGGADSDPRASVENSFGRGFIVKKGTVIGTNGGKIIDIRPDRILIEEQKTDGAGQTTTATVEMLLRGAN